MEGFDIIKDGRPYLSRLRVVQTPWFSVLLHRIHAPDLDRDPHDHPWAFASFILSGGYTEVIYSEPGSRDARIREHRRWSLHAMPLHLAHKITGIDGVLWTLVIAGRRHPSWRFWTENGPVDWKDYLRAGTGDDGSGDP
jgi:hypothetical protein